MSNALRSTIAIAIVWVIMFAVGGWFVYFKQADDLKRVCKEEEEAREKLKQMQAKVDSYPATKAELQRLKSQWYRREKVIPKVEDARITYNYFNWIGHQVGSPLSCDFLVGQEGKENDFAFHTYTVKGEDTFENVFDFIYYLENNPLLYKIESISLSGATIGETEEGPILGVKFEIEIKAYYGASPAVDEAYMPRKVAAPPKQIDPFFPLIFEQLPPNVKDLVEVEKSELQALTKDTAFVIDQHKKLVALSVGDEVYLGYLTSIDIDENKCVFTLNKGGIIQTVTLKLNFGENKDGKR